MKSASGAGFKGTDGRRISEREGGIEIEGPTDSEGSRGGPASRAATFLGAIAVRVSLAVMPALVDSECGGRFSGTDGRRISE